ncbi:MAG: hypothetical protein LBL35_01980 [Clostridiales bacterium]|jgi:fructose-specific component phosphotransferase system IIB-like protein|nr:hypothetical protein [Clostridiales bacterium]
MDEYKPNSHKAKEARQEFLPPEKKIEKVIAGAARPKKKNELQKFADIFMSEDVNNVKSYILLDVLIPAAKKAISDIVTNGIDALLYGETGGAKKNSMSSKVSYRSYYERENNRKDYTISRTKTGYDCDDIILDSRGEAEAVLSRMDEIISAYGLVSVADLYDLVGVTGDYTGNKYGWTDIRSADIIRIKDGYLIRMPKARPLD